MAEQGADIAVVLVKLEYISKGIDDIHERLDVLNGRTRTNETEIAILKDRASESKNAGRNWGVGSGTLGGIIGGFLAAFIKPGS